MPPKKQSQAAKKGNKSDTTGTTSRKRSPRGVSNRHNRKKGGRDPDLGDCIRVTREGDQRYCRIVQSFIERLTQIHNDIMTRMNDPKFDPGSQLENPNEYIDDAIRVLENFQDARFPERHEFVDG